MRRSSDNRTAAIRGTLAGLVVVVLTAGPAAAQDDPLLRSLVKLERSAEPEVETRETRLAAPPEKLASQRVYAVLQQVLVPAYVCCEPPQQVALTARNPVFERGRSSVSIELYGDISKYSLGNSHIVGIGWRSLSQPPFVYVRDTSLLQLQLRLRGMRPNYHYLADYGVSCGSCRFEIGSQTVAPTDGHVLVVLPTDERGDASVGLRHEQTGRGLSYSVYDVVVSEIGPVR